MIQATDTRDRLAISAVVSVHNRHDLLEEMILDATAVLDGLVDGSFEIVVVDDGSTDATPQLLAEMGVRRPNLPLRVVRHAARRGTAAALSSGFDAARSELIACVPGDGQFDLRELNRLLDALDEQTDLVIGYRDGWSGGVIRRLRNWSYNRLVNLLFGHTARDVDCGFKLFRRAVWLALSNSETEGALRGTTFNTELLVRARRCGFRVREVPVRQYAAGCAEELSLLALVRLRRQVSTECTNARVSANGRVA